MNLGAQYSAACGVSLLCTPQGGIRLGYPVACRGEVHWNLTKENQWSVPDEKRKILQVLISMMHDILYWDEYKQIFVIFREIIIILIHIITICS